MQGSKNRVRFSDKGLERPSRHISGVSWTHPVREWLGPGLGRRVAYEGREDRPERTVALYWPSDGGLLGVVGSISGDQDEDTLRAIAGSLISR